MKNWYRNANKECSQLASKHGIELWQVVGILTTLSGQKKWELNLLQTKQLLAGHLRLSGMVSNHQLSVCARILDGEDPLSLWAKESHKYRNFYACIMNPDCQTSVCVDSHMIRWYIERHPHTKLKKVNVNRILESRSKYKIIQDYIRRQARSLGLLPSEFQAIEWAKQRNN